MTGLGASAEMRKAPRLNLGSQTKIGKKTDRKIRRQTHPTVVFISVPQNWG